MSRETAYDVNATIFGDPESRAVLGIVSAYSGVVALVNPNGDEHLHLPDGGRYLCRQQDPDEHRD